MASKEALHCAAQHLMQYIEDTKYEKIAGLTHPCQTCKRLEVCESNPPNYLNEIREETGVNISFLKRRIN